MGGSKPDTAAQQAELKRQREDADKRASELAAQQQADAAAARRGKRGRISLIGTSEAGVASVGVTTKTGV